MLFGSQGKEIQGEVSEEKITYWKEKFKRLSPLQLPTDYTRPPVQSTHRNILRFTLEPKLTSQLQAIGKKQDATLLMTMLAAFNVLLYRYSGQEDICVGSPIAGGEIQEKDNHSDSCANYLPLRTQLQGTMSFPELLKEIRATILEAYEYQQVPFGRIVEKLGQERDLSRNPVFQVLFFYQNLRENSLQVPGVKLSEDPFHHRSGKFDLAIELTETSAGIKGAVEYCTDLYRQDTIGRMIGHYRQLLESITANPLGQVGQLKLLPEEEEQLLLRTFNDTREILPEEKTIVDLFEAQQQKTPDAVAVVFEENQLTYRELNRKANQLAHYLISKGVREESLVPICMERSLDMIIGLLGILKAGAAYVPIDPAYPKERIDFMLADTNANIAVGSSGTEEKLIQVEKAVLLDTEQDIIDKQPADYPPFAPGPHHLAYVIFTSGSTGTPKGVMIEHHSVVNILISMSKEVAFKATSSLLSVTTYSFDIFYLELFLPIINGGKVIVVSREIAMDGFYLAQMLSYYKPTHMQSTPSGWQLLLNSGWENIEGINLLVGGEALSEDLKKSLTQTEGAWNLYGPTETTIYSTIKKLTPDEKVLIGKPIDNTSIYILSKENQQTPIGVPGELCIAGEGVGRGYLNRPDLTKEKFLANPFSKETGARMYRTGDLARWLPDGNIDYLGRMDDQVKIRGYRIELGEIESILQQHGQIRQAVVLAKADKHGGKRLVGYVVAEGSFDRDVVMDFLKEKLPEHMVPSLWVEMERFPLTFNGKIDKKALPEADTSTLRDKHYEAPRTALEKQLADIWQRLLGIEKVGIDDDFFALGGHSLLAMRAIASVRKEMQRELPIRDLFSFPTIAQLAGKLQNNTLLQPALLAGVRPANIPLSYNQQSLWFIHQLEGSVQYHIPLILRIKGKLNEGALADALQTIVNRHEVLRTVFTEVDGQGYQKLIEQGQWQLDVLDGSHLAGPAHAEALQQVIAQLVQVSFDLENDHMLRACLIRISFQEYVLVLTMHHIASDGWSSYNLGKELVTLYEDYSQGRPVSLPPLQVQYIDYALWQRAYLQGELLNKKLAYWKEKLQGLSPLQLPTDFPRPPVQSTRGNILRFTLDPGLTARLHLLGKKQDATLFMVLLTAFKVLLYRYSGQEDLCVGTPTAGRERQEVEELIGFFVNTLALRSQVKGNMHFNGLLQMIRATTIEAYEYQQVPFEKVVEALVPERDMSRNPIFQVLFVLQNVPENRFPLTDPVVTKEAYGQHTANFDLAFELTETEGGVEVIVEYCTDLYRQDTIGRMIGHYKQLLESITANPLGQVGQLKLLPEEEEQLLLRTFNDTREILPEEKTIVDLFEAQQQKTPDAVAVVFEENQLTYRELNRKANQLAHYLISKGVREESLVPVCIERSLDMIIGLLGILKAGAAYVPIDPTYPQERTGYVLKDTHAAIVLTNRESKTSLPDNHEIMLIDLDTDWVNISKEPEQNPNTFPSSHHLAYVIYTSGSTGKPKGVMIEHRGLATSTMARQSYYKKSGAILLIPSFAFDSSVAVIFGSLATGGKLIVCRSEDIKNPTHLKALLRETKIILCVPSFYRFLLEEGLIAGSAISKVIVAGENLDESLVRLHHDSTDDVSLYNEYGPTECTVWSTVAKINSNSEKVTIGKPINNTSIYILGKNQELNPIGVAGELCIAGEGVSRGYLNLPELTKEKFAVNTFSQEPRARMYRTGDLARWLPDGNIEYLGRLDYQVKIRGYRIELGEIEAALDGIDNIREAVVTVREDVPGDKRLVGYIVCSEALSTLPERERQALLKKELRKLLPDYMVPGDWMFLDSLPLTANSKIDRKKLPKPLDLNPLDKVPTTNTEKLISQIWCRSLKKEAIDIQADFFEIGGHSLLSIKVMAALERQMGLKIPLNVIFKYPNIKELAKYIDESNLNEVNWNSLVPIKPNGQKPPLYMVHGVGSVVSIYYRFANFVEDDLPIYGFQPKGLNGIDIPNKSVEEMASYYISLMIHQNPEGPYCLAGYSFGGYVAYEMARQLKVMGKKVEKLILFDTAAYDQWDQLSHLKKVKLMAGKRINDFMLLYKEPAHFVRLKKRSFLRKWENLLKVLKIKPDSNFTNDKKNTIKRIASNNVNILNKFNLPPYHGKLYLFKAKNRTFYVEDTLHYGWLPFVDQVRTVNVSGHHDNIFLDPEILKEMADKIQKVLDEKDH